MNCSIEVSTCIWRPQLRMWLIEAAKPEIVSRRVGGSPLGGSGGGCWNI